MRLAVVQAVFVAPSLFGMLSLGLLSLGLLSGCGEIPVVEDIQEEEEIDTIEEIQEEIQFAFEIYNPEGFQVLYGSLEFDPLFSSGKADTMLFAGKWAFDPEIEAHLASGNLKGVLYGTGVIELDFQMYQMLTDTNIDLFGQFASEKQAVMSGRALFTTVAGRQDEGFTFRATREY